MSFPVSRHSDRELASDFSGEVFVCDIDRTYLATRFSSLKGLARIPLEFAVDKHDIEGMVPLLKEVRRGPQAQSRSTPLYFISASPKELRGVIERKMLLDGLEYDGTTFKDWGRVLRSLSLRRLREQLGFKITALLVGRQTLPAGALEVLLGDDLESDALAFALYADILARRVPEAELVPLLARHGVAEGDAHGIRRLARLVPPCAGVGRALIRMERYQAPAVFRDFAPGVLACRGAVQMAIALAAQGSISPASVVRVARDVVARGTDRSTLAERLADSVARGLTTREHAIALKAELAAAGLVEPSVELPELEADWAEALARPHDAAWTPARMRA